VVLDGETGEEFSCDPSTSPWVTAETCPHRVCGAARREIPRERFSTPSIILRAAHEVARIPEPQVRRRAACDGRAPRAESRLRIDTRQPSSPPRPDARYGTSAAPVCALISPRW